ncbi:MAG: hypothetical protein ACKO0Z_18205 [Betaproteobacteria bacterium]
MARPKLLSRVDYDFTGVQTFVATPTQDSHPASKGYVTTNFQPLDAQLTDISALATTDGGFIVGDGANFVLESGATARTSLGLGSNDSPTFNGLTVSGNLTVNGTTTTVNSTTVETADSLYHMAANNTSADSVDGGVYFSYSSDAGSTESFAGMFRDASDGKFKFFKDLTVEPTTTVDTGGTGYAIATLVVNVEGTVDGINITTLEGRVDTLETFQMAIESSNGAGEVGFSNAASGLTASTVQDAIDEIEGRVDTLESGGDGLTDPYTATFDSTTDWGGADGDGTYTITIAAATHGKGAAPTSVVVYSDDGTYYVKESGLKVRVKKSDGEVSIQVNGAGSRFAGKIAIQA